jgi:SAM-dependent methyltransferase
MSVDQHPFGYHFSDVARGYSAQRFTDPEPVAYIRGEISSLPAIAGIELGCGTGRYTADLFAALDGRLALHCVDASGEMLAELDRRLNGDYEGRYTITHATVEEARFAPGACDVVFSFNALHHFDLPHALRNIAAWLRPGGLAFLYTRTPSQNARNLWGRHFPGFVEKEDRLKDRASLLAAVDATPGLRCVEMKRFTFSRRANLDIVLDKVDNFHYSTFRLYGGDDLKAAREVFLKRLLDVYPDPEDILWTDYNLMLVVEKQG